MKTVYVVFETVYGDFDIPIPKPVGFVFNKKEAIETAKEYAKLTGSRCTWKRVDLLNTGAS